VFFFFCSSLRMVEVDADCRMTPSKLNAQVRRCECLDQVIVECKPGNDPFLLEEAAQRWACGITSDLVLLQLSVRHGAVSLAIHFAQTMS